MSATRFITAFLLSLLVFCESQDTPDKLLLSSWFNYNSESENGETDKLNDEGDKLPGLSDIGSNPHPAVVCKDGLPDLCPRWRAEGYCYRDKIKDIYCPESCGSCSKERDILTLSPDDLQSNPELHASRQVLGGCDLSGLPEEIAYHPPNKQVLGVGETVIMFCVKKPSNPKAVTCQADKLITPVDYPDCSWTDDVFNSETESSRHCYELGLVYGGPALEVHSNVRSVLECQILCRDEETCTLFTLIQENKICILRQEHSATPSKNHPIADRRKVISAKMKCVNQI